EAVADVGLVDDQGDAVIDLRHLQVRPEAQLPRAGVRDRAEGEGDGTDAIERTFFDLDEMARNDRAVGGDEVVADGADAAVAVPAHRESGLARGAVDVERLDLVLLA